MRTIGTQKDSKKYILKTLILTAAIAALSLLPAVVAGGGMLLLADDFTWQQQVFAGYNVSLLRGFGDPGYSSLIDLGSDASNALSFYGLYSPFTLLTALFPASWAPWLTAPMLVLKYIVAALGAFVFLRRYVKDQDFAVAGALLYAFSGIQTVSLLFPFHDSMAIFPWLMVAAEMALDGKPCVFALTAAVSAITNYYLFFGQALFLLIWFIFRVLVSKDFSAKAKLAAFFRTAGEGICGTLLASFVLVPVFLSVTANPRIASLERSVLFDWRTYLTIMQAYFLPADVMGEGNYMFQKACNSCALCLPFVSMSLVFAYVKGNYKKPASIFAAVLVLFSLVPFLNSAFSLFNANYYARWFYMPALVFALLSARALDENAPDGRNEKANDLFAGALVNLAFTVLTVFAAAAVVVYYYAKDVRSYVDGFDVPLLAVYGGLGVLFAALMAVFVRVGNTRKMKALILAGIIAASVFTTGAAALRYTFVKGSGDFYGSGVTNSEGNPGTAFAKAVITGSDDFGKLFPEEDDYRIRSDWREAGEGYFVNSFDNFSMLSGVPSVNSFISTVDGGLFKFYDAMGEQRLVRTAGNASDSRMALLSCRYYLCGVKLARPEAFSFTYSDGTEVYVYENEYFIPMGFLYDEYITEETLLSVPEEDRAALMLSYAVLENELPENAAAASKAKGPLPAEPGDALNIGNAVSARRASAADSFSYTGNGFTAHYDSEKGGIAFFSIPYSKGWTAVVNGEAAEICDSAGLMAVTIPGGSVNVEFTYRTPGNAAGYVLFGIGAALLPAEAVIVWRKSRKKKSESGK